MARRSRRAGHRVQAMREAHAGAPLESIPRVRLFIDATDDAQGARTERALMLDGRARMKLHVARMADSRNASGIAGGCSITFA